MIVEHSYAKYKRWLRFLTGSGINTTFSYAIYLILNTVLNYQLAYFIAYVLGIIFAYWFNSIFVFRIPLSWKGMCTYPLVYIVQYMSAALLLEFLVKSMHIEELWAPLIVAVLLVPLTYSMSRLILRWATK